MAGQFGMVAGFKSESRPASRRNRQKTILHAGITQKYALLKGGTSSAA
jgi:hypothetical protein